MLTTVEGVYRNGEIQLNELPEEVTQQIDEEVRVIVTFLPTSFIDLRAHDIDKAQAAELRARLLPFAEDWDAAEMDIYDNVMPHTPSPT